MAPYVVVFITRLLTYDQIFKQWFLVSLPSVGKQRQRWNQFNFERCYVGMHLELQVNQIFPLPKMLENDKLENFNENPLLWSNS